MTAPCSHANSTSLMAAGTWRHTSCHLTWLQHKRYYLFMYLFIRPFLSSFLSPSIPLFFPSFVRPFLHQSVPSNIRPSLPSVFYLFIYLTHKMQISKLHLNVILLFSLPCGNFKQFLHQKHVCISCLFYPDHMPSPSSPPTFH